MTPEQTVISLGQTKLSELGFQCTPDGKYGPATEKAALAYIHRTGEAPEQPKITRHINMIVVHCSATTPSMDIGAKEIDQWHRDKGWSGIGYHTVVRRDGDVEVGRPLGKSGAHAKGYNNKSIGICLVGGIDEDGKPENNFTVSQFSALEGEIRGYVNVFPIMTICGHRDLPNVAKACPSFNVVEWLDEIGLSL